MEAAFFDLDRTVISKGSMMAFGPELHRAGLLDRRGLARAAWTQAVYVHFGAGPRRLARIRRSALALTRGWSQAQVRRIVEDAAPRVLAPITYAEAVELINIHHAAGRRTYLVSASPAEVAGPVGEHLGVGEVIASRAVLDAAGRYTGSIEQYCYGPQKATLMREVARRDGVDLSASWAYTDSATDVPMLEAVGHPVAVNPDRQLRRIAEDRGWEVRRFTHPGVPPRPSPQASRSWLLAGLAVAVAALGTGGTCWARRRAPRTRDAHVVSP